MKKIFNPLDVIANMQAPAVATPIVAEASASSTLGNGTGATFNPLTSLSSTAAFKVEAAMQNLEVGICAKCKNPMDDAIIANGDSMFYCRGCRVTSPMQDSNSA